MEVGFFHVWSSTACLSFVRDVDVRIWRDPVSARPVSMSSHPISGRPNGWFARSAAMTTPTRTTIANGAMSRSSPDRRN